VLPLGIVPALLAKLRARLRRSGSQLIVRPAVDNLNVLGRHDAALAVANIGRTPATSVVVTMQVGHATFEFDGIETLPPGHSRPLTYRATRNARTRLDDTNSIPNWFRIAIRAASPNRGEMRIPLAIRYVDSDGVERMRLQVLLLDEEMRPRVRNR
jgi:hypothetical protein